MFHRLVFFTSFHGFTFFSLSFSALHRIINGTLEPLAVTCVHLHAFIVLSPQVTLWDFRFPFTRSRRGKFVFRDVFFLSFSFVVLVVVFSLAEKAIEVLTKLRPWECRSIVTSVCYYFFFFYSYIVFFIWRLPLSSLFHLICHHFLFTLYLFSFSFFFGLFTRHMYSIVLQSKYFISTIVMKEEEERQVNTQIHRHENTGRKKDSQRWRSISWQELTKNKCSNEVNIQYFYFTDHIYVRSAATERVFRVTYILYVRLSLYARSHTHTQRCKRLGWIYFTCLTYN